MENSNRTILVTSATGNQGGAVARHLLLRGNFAVRAFVRDPNKPAAQALKQAGAELVEGDLNDRASLLTLSASAKLSATIRSMSTACVSLRPRGKSDPVVLLNSALG